jgi:hypothetical protein
MTIPAPSHEALHLLRALLRECTYLPDSAARTCIKNQILAKFRARRERNFNALEEIRKGRTRLSQLSRANEGEIEPLNAVLRRTYGRVGPRRYELMRGLFQRQLGAIDSPSTSTGPTRTLLSEMGVNAPTKFDITTVQIPYIFDRPTKQGDALLYPISPEFPKLATLAKSQATRSLYARGRFRNPVFKMAAKNVWGRSMPRCRIRNSLKAWRAKLLDAILPPLPEHDWARLEGLVNGTVKWEGCRPRRKRVASKPAFLMEQDLHKFLKADLDGQLLSHAEQTEGTSKAALLHSKEEKRTNIRTSGTRKGFATASDTWLAEPELIASMKEDLLLDELHLIRPLNKLARTNNGHTITPRLMRRLWIAIFKTCPLLKQDDLNDWYVEWGRASSKQGTTIEASMSFASMFEFPASEPKHRRVRRESERSSRLHGQDSPTPGDGHGFEHSDLEVSEQSSALEQDKSTRIT